MNNSIFLTKFDGFTNGTYTKDLIGDSNVVLNPDSVPGFYNVNVSLIYTTEKNITKRLDYHFTFQVLDLVSFDNISIPAGYERIFSIKLNLHQDISELRIYFDSDGDIELDNEIIIRNNVKKGQYSFKSRIYQGESGGRQELGYHIIAIHEKRTVEFFEYNIPVHIIWLDEENTTSDEASWFNIFLKLICLIIIIIVLSFRYLSK